MAADPQTSRDMKEELVPATGAELKEDVYIVFASTYE